MYSVSLLKNIVIILFNIISYYNLPFFLFYLKLIFHNALPSQFKQLVRALKSNELLAKKKLFTTLLIISRL